MDKSTMEVEHGARGREFRGPIGINVDSERKLVARLVEKRTRTRVAQVQENTNSSIEMCLRRVGHVACELRASIRELKTSHVSKPQNTSDNRHVLLTSRRHGTVFG